MILINHSRHYTRLTLDRAERHNALVPQMLERLVAALQLPETRAAPAVLLCANGPSFSTGGDVAEFHARSEQLAEYSDHLVGLLNDTMMAIMTHPTPVVCAVNGQVCGGSLGLLLASDFVLMTHAASITPYYCVVGFSPDGGWTAILPDLIGRQRVAWCLLNNTTISAEQALNWGLVGELVKGDVVAAAEYRITQISSMLPGAVLASRGLLNAGIADMRKRLDSERKNFVEQVQTVEARTGMKRFLKKS